MAFLQRSHYTNLTCNHHQTIYINTPAHWHWTQKKKQPTNPRFKALESSPTKRLINHLFCVCLSFLRRLYRTVSCAALSIIIAMLMTMHHEANLVNALKAIIQLAVLTLATAIQHRKQRPQRHVQQSPLSSQPPHPPPPRRAAKRKSSHPQLPPLHNDAFDKSISERNDTFLEQHFSTKHRNQSSAEEHRPRCKHHHRSSSNDLTSCLGLQFNRYSSAVPSTTCPNNQLRS